MIINLSPNQINFDDIITNMDIYFTNAGGYKNNWDYTYLLTNEPTSYFNDFITENSRVLTVAGSGEQALIMCLCGATDITIFDKNPLAIAFSILMFHLIESDNITYEDFCNFLGFDKHLKKTEIFMSPKIYDKFSNSLPAKIKKFWDQLITKDYLRYLFMSSNNPKQIQDNNFHPMFNKKNFTRLKSSLKNVKITCLCCDIRELPAHLEDTYDYAHLSNIADYLEKEEYIFCVIEILNHIKNGFSSRTILVEDIDSKEKNIYPGYISLIFTLNQIAYELTISSHPLI